MARAKVCGITNSDDLRVAVDAGVDAIGLISEVPVDTPRDVDPDTAATLAAETPPFVASTLVTMPDSPQDAIDLATTVDPDVIQLHGEFTPAELRQIRVDSGCQVVPVVDSTDPDRARDYDAVADAVLVDSTSESGAGGTGETHDWERSRALARSLDSPLILAGGLTPENVAEAIAVVDPYAVDVASGVERRGGVKDHDAVRAFVANATQREVMP